ncbi:MAG: STY4851/ECs_5259 family protein [Motiliproteus sp.]
MQVTKPRTPKDWLAQFLSKRDLNFPDTRFLYQYHTTDDEYDGLREILRKSTILGLDNCAHMSKWDMAFVLFGAEWYKRHYHGTWAWEPLFDAFGADAEELSEAVRSQLVRSGLRRWHHEVDVGNGYNDYLGSLQLQGGFPLKVIENPNASLSQLFQKLTTRYIELGGTYSATELASEFKHHLPKALQKQSFYRVLGEMVENAAKLRQRHHLEKHPDPVAFLDQEQPGWRNSFPLPLNANQGAALLNDLIKNISKAKLIQKSIISVERRIKSTGSETFLIARLALPHTIFSEDFFDSDDAVPAKVELVIIDSAGQAVAKSIAYRGLMQGKEVLRPTHTCFELTGSQATTELRLFARQLDLKKEIKQGPVASQLDNQLPWVFVEKEGEWCLIGQGSVSTRQKKVRVRLTQDCSYEPVPNSIVRALDLTLNSGDLIELTGSLPVQLSTGGVCRIRTQSNQDQYASYFLNGERSWLETNADVFLGLPRIVRLDTSTTVSDMPVNLWMRPTNSKARFEPLRCGLFGLTDLQIRKGNDEVLDSRKVILLPSEFKLELTPGNNPPREGAVLLKGLEGAEVSVQENTCNVRQEIRDDILTIYTKATEGIPASLTLTFHWPGSPANVNFRVPYPAEGTQLRDPSGHVVSNTLYLDALSGYRLTLFNPTPSRERRFDISFELRRTKAADRSIQFSKTIAVTGSYRDLPLADFDDWIRKLFAASPDLDACVQLCVIHGGITLRRLEINRYNFVLEPNIALQEVQLPDAQLAQASLEELQAIRPVALSMGEPQQSPIDLPLASIGGLPTGRWHAGAPYVKPGLWLIMPKTNQSEAFRPLIWFQRNVGEQTKQDVAGLTLRQAILIPWETERNDAVKEVLCELAINSEHKGWHYVDELWQASSHLPLSTFDLWRSFTGTPQALAALIWRQDVCFVHKLLQELPVFLETIPLMDWLRLAENQLASYLRLEFPVEITNDLLEKQLEKLVLKHPGLEAAANFVRGELFGNKHSRLPEVAFKSIVSGRYDDLYARHFDDLNWPTALIPVLEQALNNIENIRNLLPPIKNGFEKAIVYLPIAVAAQATGKGEWLNPDDPVNLFHANLTKQFDETWFDQAYFLACAHFIEQ